MIIALQCEAKPVIQHYGLKRHMNETAYPVYRKQNITLTISGVGKLAAAGAVAYTQGRYGNNQSSIWLNIGVAGHANLELGSCRIAHKIVDYETSRNWYPRLLFSSSDLCETAEITTVSQPESQYNQDSLYEMEAAGFIATAIRFSTLELIHSFKVVSDNRLTSTRSLNAQTLTRLIDNQLDNIDLLKQTLEAIREQTVIANNKSVALFQNNWNFTAHQLTQLNRLLSQWQLLSADTLPSADAISQLKTSKQALHWLKTEVSTLPITF